MTIYVLDGSATNSDLGGATEFNKRLLTTGYSAGNLTPNVAKSGTENGYGFTEPNDPGSYAGSQTAASITVEVNVTGANSAITLSVFASRINSAGTVQGSETQVGAATGLGTTGVKTFGPTTVNFGTFAATDRMRLRYQFANSNSMNAQGVTIGAGTTDNEVTTPWTEPVSGSLSATDGADTATASGGIYATGDLAATDGADTFTAEGGSVTGDLAATDGADSATASGEVITSGSLSATDGADGSTASGEIVTSGSLSATDGADSATASGELITSGTLAATDGADTFTANEGVVAEGDLAATDGADGATAEGSVADAAAQTVGGGGSYRRKDIETALARLKSRRAQEAAQRAADAVAEVEAAVIAAEPSKPLRDEARALSADLDRLAQVPRTTALIKRAERIRREAEALLREIEEEEEAIVLLLAA